MGHHERFTLKLQVADEALEPAILPSLHYKHQLHFSIYPASARRRPYFIITFAKFEKSGFSKQILKF